MATIENHRLEFKQWDKCKGDSLAALRMAVKTETLKRFSFHSERGLHANKKFTNAIDSYKMLTKYE
jgi:hypothetical protein